MTHKTSSFKLIFLHNLKICLLKFNLLSIVIPSNLTDLLAVIISLSTLREALLILLTLLIMVVMGIEIKLEMKVQIGYMQSWRRLGGDGEIEG